MHRSLALHILTILIRLQLSNVKQQMSLFVVNLLLFIFKFRLQNCQLLRSITITASIRRGGGGGGNPWDFGVEKSRDQVSMQQRFYSWTGIRELMDGSVFCDKNVQISVLYCSFTVFCSFQGQLLKQKAHVFVKSRAKVIECPIMPLIGYFNICKTYFDWQLGKVHCTCSMLPSYTHVGTKINTCMRWLWW